MKRPILIATLGLIIGIMGGLYFLDMVLLSLFFSTLLIISNKKVKRIIKIFATRRVIILFVICVSMGSIYIRCLEKEFESIYTSLSNVNIVGTIISDKQEKQYNNIYVIQVEKINGKVVNNKKFLLSSKYSNLEYGDKVKINGEYIKPSEKRNYKGFDYSRYLKIEKIYGTIKQNGELELVQKKNINFISLLSNNIRNKIIKNVKKIFPNKTQGIFLGMLLGDTSFLEENIKEDFSNSSLSHLLAVSGTHVSYVVLGLTVFLKLLKIPKKFRNILISLILIFYLLLIQFTPSVTRAVIMSIIYIMQIVFYRKQDTVTTISFSSFIILINNPYALFDISFIFSYLGTIGIIAFINKFKNEKESNKKIRKFLKNVCSVTISAQIMILPFIIYYFNKISLTFVISNLIAGLLIGPIIIIGLIIVFVSFINLKFASLIAKLYNTLLVNLINISKIISNISISKIYVKTPHIVFIILYYLIIFVILLILKIQKSDRTFLKCKVNFYLNVMKNNILKYQKFILFFLVFILLVSLIYSRIPKELKIYFIDVGQGDSCLIITPNNKKILIDSGGSDNYDVGKNILLPYLLDRGITSLDYIMVSHFDTDHCKGFEYILENIKVKNIIISKQIEITNNFEVINGIVEKNKINKIIVSKGNILQLDKVSRLKILNPEDRKDYKDINDSSIVAKFECYKFSMLFTGDASQETEKYLISDTKLNLNSTVLKISHHGSKTGSGDEFLKRVNPKIALIGVGENNKFGHPANEVIEKLEKNDIQIYRTDLMGEITMIIDEKGRIKTKTQL